MSDEHDWDCIVVGGGAAGLSAALVLGRARRSTLLVDAGEPSNAAADAMGGVLGFDRRRPQDLYAQGRKELANYPSVEVRDGVVAGASGSRGSFELELGDGGRERASRVLLAMGMDYRPPAVPGIEERWGRSVFHCPFCHGWEVRGKALAVLDPTPAAAHRAPLLTAWSDGVTLLTDGPLELPDEERERVEAAGVRIDERPVAGLRGEAPGLSAVAFGDGGELACEALLVATTTHQRSDLAAQLGVSTAPNGPMAADALVVDGKFETDVPGVFAAGDTATAMPSVPTAIAEGNRAGAMAVGSLVAEP
jgi:thioredoxin reductase